MEGVIEQADDLGFQVEQGTNLFQLFHKTNSNNDTPEAVTIDNDPTKTGSVSTRSTQQSASSQSQQNNNGSGTDGEATQKTPEQLEEEKKNKELLSTMINQHTMGDQGDNSGAAAAGGGKGSQASTDNNGTGTENDPITVIYDTYTEKGILDKLPEGEEFDGSEESLDRVIEFTVENRLANAVDQTITAAIQSSNNVGLVKDLIGFLGKGGNIADFVETRRHTGIDIAKLDDGDATVKTNTAKTVLSAYFTSLNWDKTNIDRTIQTLEAAGNDALVNQAKVIFPEYQKAQEKAKADLDSSLATQKQQNELRIKQLNEGISKTITEQKEILGFDLSTKKAKDALNDYMYKPTVELNGKKVPKYYADRVQKQNTPEYQVIQALLMMNDFKIDGSKAQTAATKSLKERLDNLGKNKGAITTTAGQGTDNKDRQEAEQMPNIFDFGPDAVLELPKK